MKKFNLLVIATWLTIFGLATVPTNNSSSWDWHDNAIYEINAKFADLTWVSPINDKSEPLALNESATTQFYLSHTFTTVLFFLVALNIAFYAGKGKFGGWVATCGKKWKFAMKPIRAKLALRRRQKVGLQLRGDPPLSNINETS